MFSVAKLNKATLDFQHYVEPQLYNSGLFDPNSSYVIVCEGEDDDLKRKMDQLAGIDMCTIDTQNQVVQGIASRVQRGTCWNTFTVRAFTDNGSFDTELKKRSHAIKNGDMYPTWTIQAYIEPDAQDSSKTLCTVGIVRTVELFSYVTNQLQTIPLVTVGDFRNAVDTYSNIGDLGIRKNYGGGAIFLTCSWDLMLKENIDVKILKGVFDD